MRERLAYLNLNRILPCTLAEGPGRRFCIWVQGCKRHCDGCCNADMLPLEPRKLVSVADVCRMISEAKENDDIEGITLLGGEPMLQATNLSVVACHAHGLGLTVLVFTGYTYEECQSGALAGARELLLNTDVLVDGAFIKDRPDKVRNWVGSANQRFIYLTNAYTKAIETDIHMRNLVEVRMFDGEFFLNGDPHVVSEFMRTKGMEAGCDERLNIE